MTAKMIRRITRPLFFFLGIGGTAIPGGGGTGAEGWTACTGGLGGMLVEETAGTAAGGVGGT